ncbi:hypothetical protein Pmar_PMAR023801 [Perkinsus marinus ATCC 50983]|uniref:Uncharacterized protein n=1 Tax=Perkinsus marinus (strain ATCC 50983 / TXsc) TaxID=423536 RepID=C5KYJ2_PERM5|nr:hypothetical protein Pmar_PMAR023801 [Perkinsus marinus ATCC 50983]EER10427.1 hypothetical protein Pmar_PMAR023801 [Perkinsus marinus ATCC 50983]|eukprot:XP_002778632.1 hypothetical protein Pmar_PMAR023801 [Perkinsus marinus ATCC 50983]
MKCGIDELLRSITGKPSPEQAESLERAGTEAATMARSALELQLGESVLVRQSGNSIYHGLLGAIAERLGLADLEFPNLGAEGLPLGISVPIPHTDLYPKFKPKKQELFKLPEIHSNYKSMSFAEVKGKADEIVLNEEANGYIRRLGRLESLDERRTYIRRAAVPKGGSYENGVRIVEDFKRSNSNLNSSIPNTARLPTVSHLRQLISSLSDAHSGAVTGYKLLQLDLRSAYRHLGIHPAERKNVSFTHTFKDGSTAAFENLVLSFGHSAAAYWFVRYATLALRCLETVLQAVFTDADAKAFGTYMYVDDGFFCIRIEVYIPAAMIIIIFWLLIGSGLSFPKLRINLEEGTVIGIKIKIGEHPTFEIDPAKTEKLLSNLRDLLLNRRTTEQALSSLAGKLNRYTSLRRYLRPYLQPFYGLLAVMRKLGRKSASCPDKSEVYIVAKFFVKVLSDPRAFHSVGPIRRSENGFAGTLLLFSDASTRALGGIIALRGESSSQESQHTIWFRKHIDETVTKPWNLISKDPRVKTESKDIVITELLAVCLALQEAERYFGRLSDYRVSIHVDNQAVATILKSMYSKNPTLATLLRSIVYRLARLTLTDCVIRWIPSGENWIADRISRGESSFLPTAWREIEITPTSLKALAPNECE